MKHNNQLGARIKAKLKTQSAESIIVPKSKQNKSDVSFFQMTLGTFIFLTSLMTVYLFVQKYDGVSAATVPAPSHESAKIEKPVVSDSKFDAIENRFLKIESSLKKQHYYTWLNMIAVNENANMLKACDGRDYMTFDKDGNLTRLPKTMKLTEEQEKALEAGIDVK